MFLLAARNTPLFQYSWLGVNQFFFLWLGVKRLFALAWQVYPLE